MSDLANSIEQLLAASEEPAAPAAPIAVVVEGMPAAPVEVSVVTLPKRKPWLMTVQRDSSNEITAILAVPLE